MEPETNRNLPRSRRSGWMLFLTVILIGFVLLLGGAGYAYWHYFWPNSSHQSPDFKGMSKPIFYEGRMLELPASGSKDQLKLPLAIIQNLVDPNIRYEEQSQSVIITTENKVVRLKTSQLTGLINEKPFTLRFPVEKIDGNVYLPIESLKEYYKIDIRESEDTGAVLLLQQGDVVQWGKVASVSGKPNKLREMRATASIKAPILADLKQGDAVMLLSDENDWYQVQLPSGYIGYMKKSEIALDHVETVPFKEKTQTKAPWKPLGGKINLTWQQVFNKNPDTSKITPMPGLNVISPQWFHLADSEGNLKNAADLAFTKWAHTQGYQLWALFSNGFEPKQTSEALATYDKRIKMIKQLVSFAQMYQIDGINIDFENVYLKDKANVVQFVRELTPFLHEQGLVVSIDVTVKDGSENYSLFMDRKAVGEVVDYMMVMTYDEHWSTSPKAGSVASLPWVEKGIAQIMKEDNVPASKLILGVPLYSRVWTEAKDGKVTSKAVGMDAVQKIVKDQKLTPTLDSDSGQNYVQYKDGDNTIKIWIEDAESMKSRTELVKKYDLAGIASWSRTFETPDIWNVIKETLEKKP